MKFANNLKDVRTINSNKVLQQVYFKGPLSRLEIANKTSLSPATVGNLLIPLIEEKMVLESGFEESMGGRRRVILKINSQYGYFIGVDLGFSYINIDIFDYKMNPIHRVNCILDNEIKDNNSAFTLLKSKIDKLKEEQLTASTKILGIGIILPRLVDINRDGLISTEPQEWGGEDLKKELLDYYNIPVFIDNSAKALSLAEKWFGMGEGYNNIISTIIGRGIGSGIISDGILLRGQSNFAGEWGHSLINSSSTVEEAIIKVLNDFRRSLGLPKVTHPDIEEKEIRKFLEGNNKESKELLQDISQIVAIGLVNLINFFNPEVIILGGWLGGIISDYSLELLYNNIGKRAIANSFSKVKIIPGKFNHADICIGGASLVINNLLGFNY